MSERSIDTPSPKPGRRHLIPVVLVSGLLAACSHPEPVTQEFDATALRIDTVKRGPFVRSLGVSGRLVPETVSWITADTGADVERLAVDPGAAVKPDTLLLVLSNPQLKQLAADAEHALRAAEAAFNDLKLRLDSQRFDQQAALAAIKAEYESAELQAESDKRLYDQGLVPEINRRRSELAAEQTRLRYETERERFAKAVESHKAQRAEERQKVEQARSAHTARVDQLDRLSVRAGIAGVLKEVSVKPGDRVARGDRLALVIDSGTLKAELLAAGPEAAAIAIHQIATIDTGSHTFGGLVSRVDPAGPDGSVRLDVTPTDPPPAGAAADQPVKVTIELERIDDALQVGLPDSAITGPLRLFRVDADNTVTPVTVEFGAIAGETIVVRSGLTEGDKIILSDTSGWDDTKPIRLR